jgi:peptide/nickel transport system ATP-binding protein
MEGTQVAEDVGTVGTASQTETDPTALLTIEGLTKHYDISGGWLDTVLDEREIVHAVEDVDLTLYEGETLAIVGESGCGKSTLGRSVLNLDTPTTGSVRYRGTDLARLSQKEMRPYRRQLQMIFQDPLGPLNPRQTIGSLLRAPLEVHDIGASKADRTEIVSAMLERMGLKTTHIDRYPHQFSGGQQQRIGIARALMLEPELIVADEPVSALDVSVQAQILNLLKELRAEMRLSMLFIAHDLSVVRHIANRVAVMYLGEIVEISPVEEVFTNPQHPYTQALLTAVPRIDATKRTDRTILRGTVPSPVDPPVGCRFHTRCPAVIPPPSWEGDQEAFRRAFAFRMHVKNEHVDTESVRDRLRSEGTDPTEEEVANAIHESILEGSLETLPDAAAMAIREATWALANDNQADARRRLAEAFPSPCIDDSPVEHTVGNGHTTWCHRAVQADGGEPPEM